MEILKTIFGESYTKAVLAIGSFLMLATCIKFDKDFSFSTHAPSTFWLFGAGALLALASMLLAWNSTIRSGSSEVKTEDGNESGATSVELVARVKSCEIRIVEGRIEEFVAPGIAIALPCSEYFDRDCLSDRNSALGAFANRAFEGRIDAIAEANQLECVQRLGMGKLHQKTGDATGTSYGAGRAILLPNPLGLAYAVALISTTTQRSGDGLCARGTFVAEGMRELVSRLADCRISEVVMPLLGAGHGGVAPTSALCGQLLALAEAINHAPGRNQLKRVTIVNFRKDAASKPLIDVKVCKTVLELTCG